MPRKSAGRDPALEAMGCTPGVTYVTCHSEDVIALMKVRECYGERTFNDLCGAYFYKFLTGSDQKLSKKAIPFWLRLSASVDAIRNRILSQKPQVSAVQGPTIGSTLGTTRGDTSGGTTGTPSSIPIHNTEHLTHNTQHPAQTYSTQHAARRPAPETGSEEERRARLFFEATRRGTERP